MPTYTLKQDLSVTSIGDESVLLDLSSGQYFGLNEVGSLIIDGITKRLDLDKIVQKIIAEFAVNEDDARRDAQNLLDKLERAGLLRKRDTSNTSQD